MTFLFSRWMKWNRTEKEKQIESTSLYSNHKNNNTDYHNNTDYVIEVRLLQPMRSPIHNYDPHNITIHTEKNHTEKNHTETNQDTINNKNLNLNPIIEPTINPIIDKKYTNQTCFTIIYQWCKRRIDDG